VQMSPSIIAIDGYAGSGKSSTARAVAERLGFAHLDSGSLYRAFTLAALDGGVPLDGEVIAALGRSLPIRLALTVDGFRPETAGVDVSRAVRGDRVTAHVSAVSALPAVRDAVNLILRRAAELHPRGVVVDGRDIGTVVFPDALVKVFLIASPDERARRRLRQDGKQVDPDRVQSQAMNLEARDAADSSRPVAPLVAATDAVEIDTTTLRFEEQVERVVALARKAFA
jgi:cytidylate kinase